MMPCRMKRDRFTGAKNPVRVRAFRRVSARAFCTAAAAVVALGSLGGCDADIGDSCRVNVDCAKDGTRICDLSSPGGYCTIEGCSSGGCPKNAICVAFFPTAFLTAPCSPDTEDLACVACDPQAPDSNCNALCDPDDLVNRCEPCDPQAGDPDCNAQCDPGPATDDCLPDEVCVGSGLCAPRTAERRYCMRKCSKDSDCRARYECVRTGIGGAELAPRMGQPYPRTERKFCAPRT